MSLARSALRLALAVLLVAPALRAQRLELPAILGDHMVLQQDARAPIWGWAEPGEQVSVDASWGTWARTTAGTDGRWEVALATPDAGGPHRISVRSDKARRVLEDVLVGEVWIAGGQSNMEWTIGATPGKGTGVDGAATFIADGDRPDIRVFDVPHLAATTPARDVEARWVESSSENVAGFSAVAWLFARELNDRLGVPVGIVSTNWGGTRVESWTSPEGLADVPEMAAGLASVAEADATAAMREVEAEAAAAEWWVALDSRDPGLLDAWYDPALDDVDWLPVPVAFTFAQHGLGAHDGTVWLRRRMYVPHDWRGRDLELHLGAIDDHDQVWLDGEPLGGTTAPGTWTTPRRYHVPASLTEKVEVVVTVRVVDTGGAGGLGLGGEDVALVDPISGVARPLVLPWRLKVGTDLAGMPSAPRGAGPNRDLPSVLYHGMVAPLAPFRTRGVIFYQGESNRLEAELYRRLFPALIRDWRRVFDAELPFYFVQIAPFGYDGDTGQASELREAQAMALELPRTGMVTTTDVGDPTDIHPRAKLPVAERLALLARRRLYAEPGLVDSAPRAIELESTRRGLRVRFDDAGEGLATSDGEAPTHLEVAGEDGVWHPAVAKIDGDALVLTSAVVLDPVAVRFAWGAADQPNLVGPTGLPVGPFRLPLP